MAKVRKRQWEQASGKLKTAWLVDYRDEHGRRRAKQFASKADANDWLDGTNLKAICAAGPATFEDAASSWLARAESEELEQSTLVGYRYLVRSYLIPGLGKLRLDQMKAADVVAFRKALTTTKSAELARRATAHAKMILRYAFDSDLTDRDIGRSIKAKKAKRHRERPAIPTRNEMRKLLKGAAVRRGPERYPLAPMRDQVLYMIMAETGIRPCEARALGWPQVDFIRREIEIVRDAKIDNTIGAVKTAAARRRIPISAVLVRKLHEWRKLCPRSKCRRRTIEPNESFESR